MVLCAFAAVIHAGAGAFANDSTTTAVCCVPKVDGSASASTVMLDRLDPSAMVCCIFTPGTRT